MTDEEMGVLLQATLGGIGREISDLIFFGIIDCADGSPRQALVLLEQVLSLEEEKEQLDLLKKSVIEHEVIELCRLLLKGGKWETISAVYKGIPEAEPEMIRRTILGYMKSVLLSNNNGKAFRLIKIFSGDVFTFGVPALVGMLYESYLEE